MCTPAHWRCGTAVVLATFVLVARVSSQQAIDSSGVDFAPVAEIARLAATQTFDTVAGAGNEYPITTTAVYGANWTRIEPDLSVYKVDTVVLARGYIVARIWSDADYEPLGLGRGVNWWWVDRRGGQWRSIIISESLNTSKIRIVGTLETHGHYRWKQSIARLGPERVQAKTKLPIPWKITCWASGGDGSCMHC